jgi:hypothetical protein
LCAVVRGRCRQNCRHPVPSTFRTFDPHPDSLSYTSQRSTSAERLYRLR